MSVSKQENPAAARFARWLLGCAVRHWPEETRPWGLALAAEIDETASAFEAVRWSLGGIIFFARSLLSGAWAWMRLPAGVSLPDASGPEGPSLLPKRSRVFTAAILAAAALLLFLPVGREAIRTVWASWQGFQESASDQRTLEELAARAEKEKDAGTLAFVALSITDPKRAAALTERAVSLDPHLVWVYGARNHRPNFDPPQEEWLARLKAADPGNAVPDLLMADALVEPSVDVFYEHWTPKDADFDVVESDSKWMALMERAFGTQRYDSYFQRHYQLTRTMWNRERNLSPNLILRQLRSHAFPNLAHLRTFAKVKIHEAQKARAAGDLQRAESLLGEVDAFGMRMADGSETNIEKWIALSLSRGAEKELAVLYSSSGKTEEERKVTLRMEQLYKSAEAFWPGQDLASSARAQAFRREAMLLQGFGTLSLIAGFAALAGILLLELWPQRIRNTTTMWRRATCWLADYAPATMLAASGAFLMSFLPFQRVLADYRSSNYLLGDQRRLVEDALWSLIEIPDYVMGVNARVSIWAFVTIVLTSLLLFVVARSIYRTRRAASNPA